MVKIRLTRLGKHKAPFYRIVATDSRTKRDGEYIALLGTFEPNKGTVKLKKELIVDFLKNGAQPTETILSMLKAEGVWAEYLKTKKIHKKHKRKLTTKMATAKKEKGKLRAKKTKEAAKPAAPTPESK